MAKSLKHRMCPTVVELEGRAVPTALGDPVGTFAVVDGRLALPNQATSPRLNFDRTYFRYAGNGGIAVKIVGTASDGGDLLMGPAVKDRFVNPLPSNRPIPLPTVFQFPAGRNAQIVNFHPGQYSFPVSGGWSNRVGSYHLSIQIVGDANGDMKVDNTDIKLIRQMISNPASVPLNVYQSADYDGSGKVANRDIILARQNLGVVSNIRPLAFASAIDPSVTPVFHGYVRSSNIALVLSGSPGAGFLATNLSLPTSTETGGVVGVNGLSQIALPVALGSNSISVSARDSFGQSLETFISVNRLPVAVVVLPDLGGTVPRNQTPEGLSAFYGNRGTPASQLMLTNDYTPLFASLSATGYQPGRDLFAVPYDWRLAQAPTDGAADGTLANLTTSVMTQSIPAYEVSYFGQVLASMVANDPTITSVDIVGVGGGSLLARAYLQSPSYGSTFEVGVSTLKLPQVDSLVMVSAPNEGVPQFLNPWNNDFNDAFGSTTGSVMAALNPLYSGVAAGTSTVPGTDVTINQSAIIDPSTSLPSPLIFAHLYFPSFRQTIADTNFLSINGLLTNVNLVPGTSPDLLLDLNAANTAGNSPWLARIPQASASFGVTTTTITQLTQQTGLGGTVWPIGQAAPIPTVDNQVWYQSTTTTDVGDGVVPLDSLLSVFPNDLKITLQLWGSPSITPPPGITFTSTNGPVTHIGLLSNIDFLTWLRNRLVQ
ncbi:MAG: hypothetical protein NT172_08390 [Planctomycetota bacterium]|nr:hypothetical protein [Planctomycetota bacterium]